MIRAASISTLIVAAALTVPAAADDLPLPTPRPSPSTAASTAPPTIGTVGVKAPKKGRNLTLAGGSQDVTIKSARYYDTNDNSTESNNQVYLIATLTFTNDTGLDLVPKIDHFNFVDALNRRFTGVDSGNAALIGISNYAGVVKRGESHDYTIGFRVLADVAGQIIYDTSY